MRASDATALREFDRLPDSAKVRLPVVAALFSISAATVWRWTHAGLLPQPTQKGGVTAWNVGELRAELAKRSPRSDPPPPPPPTQAS
jgi:predicted DNA-binding transcriptional regulator AlpA